MVQLCVTAGCTILFHPLCELVKTPFPKQKLASGDLMLRSPDASAPAVVLVVEENLVLRSAFATRLRSAGFEVLEAANSAEAERILERTLVDALFLSVRT